MGEPRATVDRVLQALNQIGLASLDEVVVAKRDGGTQTLWHYSISSEQHRDAPP